MSVILHAKVACKMSLHPARGRYMPSSVYVHVEMKHIFSEIVILFFINSLYVFEHLTSRCRCPAPHPAADHAGS